MADEVRWERMFPDQLEAVFAACPVVYFPYGMCEPHGPQNAIGLDALKAHAICVQAARSHGGIVAPADYWHIHEIGGYADWGAKYIGEVPRTWLTAMPPWQHFKNVLYHLRQADLLGFKAAILFTGHYGPNWQDLRDMLELVQPYVGTRIYGLPDFEANQPGFDGQSGDHAGKVETSLLWALMPQCVDISRLPLPHTPGPHFAMGSDACKSDRRIGERMVSDEVKFLGEKARQMLEDFDRIKPQHQLLTFAGVEELWEKVVQPRLPGFRTMQQHWEETDVPPNSMWRRNSPIPPTA